MGQVMLTIATLMWKPNNSSKSFSHCYSEAWVERLYRGFERNLTKPFNFVLFTDEKRHFAEPLKQIVDPTLGSGGYGDCIRPYSLGKPMILVGLDTVVTGNIDHLAEYALKEKIFALPRDPFRLTQACNGVALVPKGHKNIGLTHAGQNDMEWVRNFKHVFIDDLFPGHVVSYKGTIKKRHNRLDDARIVYFHGQEKPHQLSGLSWIKEHWR